MKKVAKRSYLRNRSIPALVAVGTGLAALPAGALELGELSVQSRLSQPLRASIAYSLAPNEQLSDYCVTVRSGPSGNGLPGFGNASVSVANGIIRLTGGHPVREPIVSARVTVNCPYSAKLDREYMLFIDPAPIADQATQQQAITTQTIVPQAGRAVTISAAPAVVKNAGTVPGVEKDIRTATSYRVRVNESLSEIVLRIENRSVGLWPAVAEIFATNPDAFRNNDPNQLRAGSMLLIPSFGGGPTIVEAATETPVSMGEAEIVAEPVAERLLINMTADLQPSDIVPFAESESPVTAASLPDAPASIIVSKSENLVADGAASTSWLGWLASSAIALVFGLLMIGRRLRSRADMTPAAPRAEQLQRDHGGETQSSDLENVESAAVDYDLTDDSPTEENLALDANLAVGTGLEVAAAIDAEDVGLAAPAELDIELPFEPIAQSSDETEVLPPLRADENSILDSEIMPEDIDDDYSISVVIDATKTPQPEDATERDLKAVEITNDDDALETENYTISNEVDFHVLEQDYEDEMTATRALNEEIARAASELSTRDDDNNDDASTALPLACVIDLDSASQAPAQNDDFPDLDETGINEAITVNTTADDDTVEMPAGRGKAGQ